MEHFQRIYQEIQARQNFIDPLFKALSWNVQHGRQHPPQYGDEFKRKANMKICSPRFEQQQPD
jgi:hypothetical protein